VKSIIAALVLLAAAPAYAQIDVRPFAMFASERFAASTTFNAVFESNTAPVWGGGIDIAIHRRFFLDLTISHMSKTGQRAFFNNGDVFRLGIPLKVTSTPVEIAAGYRFRLKTSRVIPYAGAGFGSYSYRETADFAAAGDDVDVRHAGFLLIGGAEFRIRKWVGITGDAQYTRVPGILGQAGLSRDVNESDFGGVAARVRVILGR
jgi:outer membrane protein W